MKFWQWLVLLVVFFAGVIASLLIVVDSGWRPVPERFSGSLQLIEAEKPATLPMRYEFHYAGVQKWSNVFAIYRMDKQSGKVERLSYTVYEEDKTKGVPAFDAVESLEFETGESTRWINSHNREEVLEAMVSFNARLKKGQEKHAVDNLVLPPDEWDRIGKAKE